MFMKHATNIFQRYNTMLVFNKIEIDHIPNESKDLQC